MHTLKILTDLYTNPKRTYHNLSHIANMFDVASRNNLKLDDSLIAAIWWHDAIYIPGATDNEEKSIELFMEHNAHLDHNEAHMFYLDNVSKLIMATKHIREPANESEAIIMDLDMSGFAASMPVYVKLMRGIEDEYTQVYTQTEYLKGRIKFLTELLDKPIYYHDKFKQYRNRAIAAIDYELSMLEPRLRSIH